MHSAPSVDFAFRRSRLQAWLMVVLVVCESLSLAAWYLSVDVIAWPQAGAGVLVLVFSVWLLATWWQTPEGHMSWDGLFWTLSLKGKMAAVNPELVLDLQVVILLRLIEPDGVHVSWVWLDRASNPIRWMALRRAVHNPPVSSLEKSGRMDSSAEIAARIP
jgi:hypothetical protein